MSGCKTNHNFWAELTTPSALRFGCCGSISSSVHTGNKRINKRRGSYSAYRERPRVYITILKLPAVYQQDLRGGKQMINSGDPGRVSTSPFHDFALSEQIKTSRDSLTHRSTLGAGCWKSPRVFHLQLNRQSSFLSHSLLRLVSYDAKVSAKIILIIGSNTWMWKGSNASWDQCEPAGRCILEEHLLLLNGTYDISWNCAKEKLLHLHHHIISF